MYTELPAAALPPIWTACQIGAKLILTYVGSAYVRWIQFTVCSL